VKKLFTAHLENKGPAQNRRAVRHSRRNLRALGPLST
jgi:hypothetical protein